RAERLHLPDRLVDLPVDADDELAVAADGPLTTALPADVRAVVLVVHVHALVSDLHVDRLEGVEPAAAADVDGPDGVARLGLGHRDRRVVLAGHPVPAAADLAAGGHPDRLDAPGVLALGVGGVVEPDQVRALGRDLLELHVVERPADDAPL